MATKTLSDWSKAMSELYERMFKNDIELDDAAELANICGKALKAEALITARQMFELQYGNKLTIKPDVRQLSAPK